MPAYIVASIRVTDTETYEEYKKLAGPSNAVYGGRYLARGGRSQVLEGDMEANRMVLVEFPTYEAALAWHESADYAPAKQLRHKAAESIFILMDGVEEPTA